MDAVAVFTALCESRAIRWWNYEWDEIGDAVDFLQDWAEANGLVRELGQDRVQLIIAEAFDPAPLDAPDPWTESAKAWRAEHPTSNHPAAPPPTRCEHCDPGPCRFPTFCGLLVQADKWWAKIPPHHPLRRGRHA